MSTSFSYRYVWAAPLVLAGLLSACAGYSPLYAPQGPVAGVAIGAVAMDEVEVAPGQRLVAQEIRQRLLQSFPHAQAPHVAEITVAEDATTLALRRTAAIERVQLTLTATLKVHDEAGKEVLNTQLTSTAAYNVETTPFSTESGKAYARQIAARNLADGLARRLALWARTE